MNCTIWVCNYCGKQNHITEICQKCGHPYGTKTREERVRIALIAGYDIVEAKNIIAKEDKVALMRLHDDRNL